VIEIRRQEKILRSDSEEELNGKGVMVRTVEFKAVSEGSASPTVGRETPTMNL
jgi:hypothetical protein